MPEPSTSEAPFDRPEESAIGQADTAALPRRRRWVRWVVLAGALVVLLTCAGLLHLWANQSFDERELAFVAELAEAEEAQQDLTADAQVAFATAASADQVVGAAVDGLVGVDARTAVSEASAATGQAVEDAEQALDPLPATIDKPLWTWELIGLLPELDARADRAADDREAALDAAVAVEESKETLDAAGQALFETVGPAAQALEAANVSAKTDAVLDFRDAAKAAGDQTDLGSAASVAFSTYASAAAALAQSSKAELAEKAGPLYDTRLAIEAFARSISGGVVLDFDWAPWVAGAGGPYSMGGTATWNSGRGGFSTITLSHSVAEEWPSADAKALVAHEVGHAITSKCWSKFDSQDADANEEWATAWAFGMGHTTQGNGTYAYGAPSQAMIDLAKTCR